MYPVKKVFDKVDVICEHKHDGTIIPIKFRLMNEDGLWEVYSIKSYKPNNNNSTHTTKDGIYVSSTTEIYECKVVIFGLERTVRLYHSQKGSLTEWQLAI
jgi:hypothetical protein